MRYAHNKWTKQPFPSAASVAGGGFALIVVVIAWLVLTATPERARAPVSAMAQGPGTHAGAGVPSISPSKPAKLVYRHSVLPGGVHSAAELAFALRGDPVASRHYTGFDVAAAHIVRVEKSRLVHVSYRIGDNIYWTKHKVRLAVGEEMLSDGTHLVRARCGNRIADEPQGVILDNEPAPEVLDSLMVSAEGLVDASAHMPVVGNAMSPAAAAQTVEEAQPLRLASNVQVSTPPPFASWRNPSTPPTLAPPVSVSTPAPGSPTQFPVGPTIGAPSTPAAPAPATPVGDAPAPLPQGPTAGPQPSPPAVPVPDSPAPLPPAPTVGPQPAAPEAPTQIPEPGSAALAAVALAAFGLARRRGKRPAMHTQSP